MMDQFKFADVISTHDKDKDKDNENNNPKMMNVHRYANFGSGIVIGFMVANLMPLWMSAYLRASMVRFLDTVVVVMVWGLVLAAAWLVFRPHRAATNNNNNEDDDVTVPGAGDGDQEALSNLDRQGTGGKQPRVATGLSPSSEHAAQPYGMPWHRGTLSGKSSPEYLTTLPDGLKTTAAPDGKNQTQSRVGKSLKHNHKDDDGGKKAVKHGHAPAAISSARLSAKDPNRVELTCAFVSTDLFATTTPPSKILAKDMSLRISPEGLFVDDGHDSNGCDLQTWMISCIEDDISRSCVMRATTRTEPPIQVTYMISRKDAWKATVALQALKRDRQALGIRVNTVDGLQIRNELIGLRLL
ncbi:hypothetical protein V1514DRAFT_338525 [Lipomyces japonicus]|uniref:uncharacterized protein n=1 Tax=Lipomyces japonicus TaxID=56871 RepID=UPI0034CEF99F